MTLSLKQWSLGLGLVTAVGLLKAVERNSLWLGAHAAGQRLVRLHAMENDTQRLRIDVSQLQSPSHLAKTMAASHPTLVAWSTMRAVARGARMAAVPRRDE